VHRHGPVDRPINRGKGTVDRPGRPAERRNSRLVPVDRASRQRTRIGQLAG